MASFADSSAISESSSGSISTSTAFPLWSDIFGLFVGFGCNNCGASAACDGINVRFKVFFFRVIISTVDGVERHSGIVILEFCSNKNSKIPANLCLFRVLIFFPAHLIVQRDKILFEIHFYLICRLNGFCDVICLLAQYRAASIAWFHSSIGSPVGFPVRLSITQL